MFPPKKNTAFTLYFTLYKSDGTIIANPGTFTKKVSIDGAAVADITAAVTEEDTTYGQCSVVLSAAEMNGDAIWVYLVDNTANAVPFIITLYTAAYTLDELYTLVADVPTTAEFEARTLVAASYFDPAADTVARVTLVDTCTANTDVGSKVTAIKAKTDDLTFTVSKQVDVNIQSINDTEVVGDGETATPWGPA